MHCYAAYLNENFIHSQISISGYLSFDLRHFENVNSRLISGTYIPGR